MTPKQHILAYLITDRKMLRQTYLMYIFLMICIFSGSHASSEYVDTNHSELYWLIADTRIKQGVVERARTLIGAGEDVNFIRKSNKSDIESCILSQAIARQDYDLVKLLIDSGAEVNPVLKKGSTPISTAVSYDKESSQKIIRLLVDSGLDFTSPSFFPAKIDNGVKNTVIRSILRSRLVQDETKIYTIEEFVEQGLKFKLSDLPHALPKNARLLKKIIKLQPSVLRLTRRLTGTTYRESLTKSKYEEISSILQD